MSIKRIEDAIKQHLTGEAQKNALDFTAHLRAKDAVINDSDNYFWHPKYKGTELCIINIEVGETGSSLDTFINSWPSAWENQPGAAEPSIDDRVKEILWANVRPCEPDCNCRQSPGIRKVIFGKEFNNLCRSFLGIYNPDADTVDCMKKIVDGLASDVDGTVTKG